MSKKILLIILVLLIGATTYFLVGGKSKISTHDLVSTITCDAENISSGYFVSKEVKFNNGNTQSDEKSHKGNYSSKLTKSNKEGLGIRLINLHPGDNLDVSCWVYGKFDKSILFAKGVGDYDFNYSDCDELDNITQYVKPEKDYTKWRKVKMKLLVISQLDNVSMDIYTKLPEGCEEAFVDDLVITKFNEKDYVAPAPLEGIRNIRIDLDSISYERLKLQRMRAMHDGIIVNTGEYESGNMLFDSIESKVKIRLKGDWPDHLEKLKWSLRIKTSGVDYCDRLKVFSIQAPHTKNYLNEWLVHKMMDQEDVLAPRYDFVYFNMNGRDLGIYAREEHFVKQLLESKNRREGPIVKFSEDEMWAANLAHDVKLPDDLVRQAAVATAFNKKKLKKKPTQETYFHIAQNLLFQYKNGLRKPSEIFNIDKLARYYALVDVTRSTHALRWHNQRFYYNPVIGKLEPIYFDGFVTKGEFNSAAPFLINRNEMPKHVQHIFSDDEFIQLYKQYSAKYSSVEWLKEVLQIYSSDIEKYESALIQEYPEYQFHQDFFFKRAKEFRSVLEKSADNFDIAIKKQEKLKKDMPVADQISVVAFRPRAGVDSLKVHIRNYHHSDIEIVGIGKLKVLEKINENTTIKAYSSGMAQTDDVNFILESKYLFFRVAGDTKVYRTKIFKQPPPTNQSPVQDLVKNSQRPKDIDGVKIENQQIIFPEGKYSITQSLVIPKGYKVSFEAGAKINLTNGASFVSYSPVSSTGTAMKPVKIYSSDTTGRGFTVLNPKGKCEFVHTTFEQLRPLEYKGWVLTGCVTVYKTEVELRNVKILNTIGEDALNLIRCNFTMDQCEISGTLSDAFDGDFCKGTVKSTLFTRVGNDALDYSGSDIVINDVKVIGAGDKGISSGENSRIKVSNVQITNSNLGIASKDLSNVQASGIRLNNVNIGFLAYQKKSEYGGATINVQSSTLFNVKKQHNIAPGSILILNGTRIVGKDYISSELF